MNKKNLNKKSNSNPIRSLFEVEFFLKKIDKIKSFITIKNNIDKLKK